MIGVPKREKLFEIGDNIRSDNTDNFWKSDGDTGPCVPLFWKCFTIMASIIWGGPPGSPEERGDPFIWNFGRSFQCNSIVLRWALMVPLPKPSVETGMGLERIAAISAKAYIATTNWLFPEFNQGRCEISCNWRLSAQSIACYCRHIVHRSFMIVDGVIPSNEAWLCLASHCLSCPFVHGK